MKNLYVANLDIVDYVMNDELEKVASIVSDVRTNAQNAYIPSYDEQLDHSQNDFAIVIFNSKNKPLRKFACYNEELTELNMALLITELEHLPEEIVKVAATNLTASATKFNIPVPEELKKYSTKKYCNRLVNTDKIDITKPAIKIAEVNNINIKYALGNKYPISDEQQLYKAAEWFGRNYTKLTIDEQREFINNVKTQISEIGIELTKTAMSDFVTLDETSFNPEFYNHINVRKSLTTLDEQVDIKEAYNDLMRRADELGPIKVAYILEMLDKEAGVEYQYETVIVDPLRATLGTIKTAGKNIDGINITLDKLKLIDKEKLSSAIGSYNVNNLLKEGGLEVLASFPTPVRRAVVKLINE